jgi:hypothetical protein
LGKQYEVNKRWLLNNPEAGMVFKARQRAKQLGVPCTIKRSDIVIPEMCPVLGVRLVKGRGGPCDSSPSLDRIIPSLGYVPGNVRVISQRANRIKNDATSLELRLVASYIELSASQVNKEL